MFCQVNQKGIVESLDIGHILVEGVRIVKEKEINNAAPLHHEVMTLSGEDAERNF
jgi:hypothetical protein